jgi:hypothetical protein
MAQPFHEVVGLDIDSIRPLNQFLVCPLSLILNALPQFFLASDRRVAVWVAALCDALTKHPSSYPPKPVDASFCAQVHCTTTLLREQTDEWLVLTTFPF